MAPSLRGCDMVWQAIVRRAKFAWACAGPGRRTVIGVFAVLGAISTIRDNFLPKADIALINWILPFPWYVWTIIILILLFLFAVEGGYRIQERLEEQPMFERQRVISLLEKRLEVGDQVIQLQLAATIWLGHEHGNDTNQMLEWNYRFRRLKQAVSAGEIQATNLQPDGQPSLTTEADIRSLIAYFRNDGGS